MDDNREEILRIVREVVVPLVRADGGTVFLVEAGTDVVSLHLGGRYSGCPGNTLAIRRVIEPAIFTVAPRAKVTITSGALKPKGAEPLAE